MLARSNVYYEHLSKHLDIFINNIKNKRKKIMGIVAMTEE